MAESYSNQVIYTVNTNVVSTAAREEYGVIYSVYWLHSTGPGIMAESYSNQLNMYCLVPTLMLFQLPLGKSMGSFISSTGYTVQVQV